MPSPEWTVLATYSYLGCATSLLRWLCKWFSLSYARGQGILYSIGEKGRGPERAIRPFSFYRDSHFNYSKEQEVTYSIQLEGRSNAEEKKDVIKTATHFTRKLTHR